MWNIKQLVLAPILVNIISAFILFLSFVLLQDKVLDLLGWGNQQWPVHCIPEIRYGENEKLIVDLFVFNQSSKLITENSLQEQLKLSGVDFLNPHIQLEWTASSGKILSVTSQDEFNKEKGILNVKEPEKNKGKWTIKIEELTSKALMKYTIITDSTRKISPSAKGSIPFKIIYPGT